LHGIYANLCATALERLRATPFRRLGNAVEDAPVMSDPRPDDDPELIVSLPEGSLDDLFAGLEASLQQTPSSTTPEPVKEPEPAHPALPSAPEQEAPAAPQRVERRGAVRKEPHEFKCELRLAVAGFPMRLVNLSSTGLLAETNQRLCPGRTVDVFLRYGGIRRVLRATVIRSTMHAVAPTPVFRAALQFEEVLTLQDAEL
jgi:PilZ domain